MDQPVTEAVTKKPPANFRNACITWFTDERPLELWDKRLKFVAYGVETCPTTQRVHLQMFAVCVSAQRLSGWKKIFPGAHIEQMMGNFGENEDYCSKESKLTCLGVKPNPNGLRIDVDTFCQRLKAGEKLKDVAIDMHATFVQYNNGLTRLSAFLGAPYQHSDVRGVWVYGVPGSGKTHYARNRFSDIYIKSQNKWFDGYNGEKTILLDDYDCFRALGHYLKIWADKWACNGEIKGGTVCLQHEHFVVTSNYSINDMFGGDDALVKAVSRRFTSIYFPEVFKA